MSGLFGIKRGYALYHLPEQESYRRPLHCFQYVRFDTELLRRNEGLPGGDDQSVVFL